MNKKSQQNYADFLHADYGHSFAEWLGIEVPEIERHPTNRNLIRMVSRKNKYKGNYCDLPYFTTKKAAKADYKKRQKIAAQKNKEANLHLTTAKVCNCQSTTAHI